MITQIDIDNYKKLKMIISQGNYDIKGNALVSVALLFKWFEEFEPVLEKLLKEEKRKGIPKIKKIGEK